MTHKNEHTALISSISPDGRGITRLGGKTVFIDGALPNEHVRFRYLKRHRRYDEAVVIEVDSAAPNRVPAKCPAFGHCGGCNMQHLPTRDQLTLKQNWFIEQLQHVGHCQPENLLPALTGPSWGYRHKARLSVRYVSKKERVLIGFREKNGRYVADLNDCPILAPAAAALIAPLSDLICDLTAREHIAQLEIAVGDEAVAIIVRHLVPLDLNDQNAWLHFAQTHRCHLYWQPKGPDSIRRFWPETGTDRLHYTLPEQDLRFAFHPSDFTQINPALNQSMVNQALQLLAPNRHDHILDLFCGLGNFSLPLAQLCHTVTGVEGHPEMVKRAQENAAKHQLQHLAFHCADLSRPPTPSLAWCQPNYSKLLLDPPRSGAQAIVHNMHLFQPQQILYISCHPATLARDAEILVHQQGYRLRDAGIMDMFPHTQHVEAMALFTK